VSSTTRKRAQTRELACHLGIEEKRSLPMPEKKDSSFLRKKKVGREIVLLYRERNGPLVRRGKGGKGGTEAMRMERSNRESVD